jgi:hypothetical protein
LALVESDLNQAEALFDKSLPTRARASIWAVYALKARLYLYQERWDKAEEYATKVLENTSFALTTEVRDWYEKPFQQMQSSSWYSLLLIRIPYTPTICQPL